MEKLESGGFFVTVEGGEGSGKSTLVKMLCDHFTKMGIDVVKTNDPGATELGMEMRKLLLDPKWKNKSRKTELYLYHACRTELIDTVIKPARAENKLVICDRFYDSTWVYQGGLRGWNHFTLNELDNITNDGIFPDLTLLCDVDAKIGLQRSMKMNNERLDNNGNDESMWESMGLKTHMKINSLFLSRALDDKERFRIIDSNNLNHEQMLEKAVKILIVKLMYHRRLKTIKTGHEITPILLQCKKCNKPYMAFRGMMSLEPEKQPCPNCMKGVDLTHLVPKFEG